MPMTRMVDVAQSKFVGSRETRKTAILYVGYEGGRGIRKTVVISETVARLPSEFNNMSIVGVSAQHREGECYGEPCGVPVGRGSTDYGCARIQTTMWSKNANWCAVSSARQRCRRTLQTPRRPLDWSAYEKR
jgi:hypothetical protein